PALRRGATKKRKRAAKAIVAGAVEAAPGVEVGTAPAVAASVVLVAAEVFRIALAAVDSEAVDSEAEASAAVAAGVDSGRRDFDCFAVQCLCLCASSSS